MFCFCFHGFIGIWVGISAGREFLRLACVAIFHKSFGKQEIPVFGFRLFCIGRSIRTHGRHYHAYVPDITFKKAKRTHVPLLQEIMRN